MDNSKRIFGGRLKGLRKSHHLTQDAFAAKLNVGPATVKNWEQGRTWPEMEDFLRLCSFFKCDADYLLGRIDEQTHDLDFVCKYTGLAADSVEKLHSVCFDEQSKLLLDRLIVGYGGEYHDLYSYIAQAVDCNRIARNSHNGGDVDTWKQNRLKSFGVLSKDAPETPGTVVFGAKRAVDFSLSEATRVFREFANAFVSSTGKKEDAKNEE